MNQAMSISADGMEPSRGEEGSVMIHPDSPTVLAAMDSTMDVQAAATWDLEMGLRDRDAPDHEPPTPEFTAEPMDIDQYVDPPTHDPYCIKPCSCCIGSILLVGFTATLALLFLVFVGNRSGF